MTGRWSSSRPAAAAATVVLALGCRSGDATVVTGTAVAPASASAPLPLDRLAPGELAPGNQKAFGLVLPRKMRLDRQFPGVAHVVGDVVPEDLANYVRQRVIVSHIEVGAGRTVFPRAQMKGDASGKFYQIDVAAEHGKTRLVIRDLSAPPMPEGLSEAERWRRAGFTADGKPLDPGKLD